MTKKGKGFICRNCGVRVITSNTNKNHCKICNHLVCDNCMLEKHCIDCFTKHKASKLVDIYYEDILIQKC